ncbi:MAG: HNH endonuclease signature motif containing protein [Sulfuricaulis sp.]|nr:HNH endonuclease signature motif containing protein [Sulfuricaulis sp.]
MVLEHRKVWEEANAQRLQPDEDVHHANGVKTDNRPENLVALTHSGHVLIREYTANSLATKQQLSEAGKKGSRILNLKRWGVTPEDASEILICPQCDRPFRAWCKRHRRYCSRACAGAARCAT